MNPLTAIRQMVSPELRPVGLPKTNQAEGVSTVIPTAELKEMPGIGSVAASGQTSGVETSFGNVLGRLVNEVNTKQAAANDASGALLSGQNVSLHQTVTAVEEASISFQLMVEVRNKLLESYQELMRMQV
jgi:flagellar hook-basal body complex protein FliE